MQGTDLSTGSISGSVSQSTKSRRTTSSRGSVSGVSSSSLDLSKMPDGMSESDQMTWVKTQEHELAKKNADKAVSKVKTFCNTVANELASLSFTGLGIDNATQCRTMRAEPPPHFHWQARDASLLFASARPIISILANSCLCFASG